MPNVNAPFGLAPVNHLMGAWRGQGRTYYIPSSDPNAYAIGDPVVLGGGADANGVPSAILATAGGGNLVLGSIMGMGGKAFGGAIGVNPLGNQDTTIIPATKTVPYYILVADDPYTIFNIQESNTGTALTAAEVGLNVSLISGANNGYQSGWVLGNADEAGTSTLQMKIMGLAQSPGNAYGLAAIWLVMINNHCYKAGSAGS